MRLVLDTDVIVAAFRSPTGASSAVLQHALDGKCVMLVSVALALEYEAVVKRPEQLEAMGMSLEQADKRIRSVVAVCEPVFQAYSWRPQLMDPDDEMILEAAVNGGAELLVTFNQRHFGKAPAAFGIKCLLPRDALERIRK
jgi:putative PIN family toxin of toxin-antitoxin system